MRSVRSLIEVESGQDSTERHHAMFTSVTIENFRCFEKFELQKLGRVNLLVGKNNCGKTSVLEAIQLLCAGVNLSSLQSLMRVRGEFLLQDRDSPLFESGRDLDPSNLFNGREFAPGSYFSVTGICKQERSSSLKFSVQRSIDQYETLRLGKNGDLSLVIEFSPNEQKEPITIVIGTSEEGGIPESSLSPKALRHLQLSSEGNEENRIQYLSVQSSSSLNWNLTKLFGKIVLTPEEEIITETLQIVEPNVLRLAVLSQGDGFVVRLANSKERVPLGTLGDGVLRILALALSLVNARGGFLFVDDIDTGLHYSTMEKMWQLIWETAKKLDVQVFATTHSDDCWRSLAAIAERDDAKTDGVSIQRIEKGKNKAINFTGREIVIAAERELEVR